MPPSPAVTKAQFTFRDEQWSGRRRLLLRARDPAGQEHGVGKSHLGAEEELSPQIGGVIVAAVTPRRKDGREVDVAAALELIDFLCAAGVSGIALLGSTGEFLNLTFDERVRLTYMAAKRSRVPLLVGVGHSSFDGAVELGREAAGPGAAGLLLMPPYFFRYNQEDIREFYLRFAAQMGAQAQHFLYNIPFFTNELESETAVELLQTGQFAGIKDSSGRMEYFERLAAARTGKSIHAAGGQRRDLHEGAQGGRGWRGIRAWPAPCRS